MAKNAKKTAKAELTNELQLNIKSDIDIDKNDVLAIAISAAEDEMRDQLAMAKEELKTAEQLAEKALELSNKAKRKLAETAAKKYITAAKKYYKVINPEGKVTADVLIDSVSSLVNNKELYPDGFKGEPLCLQATVNFAVDDSKNISQGVGKVDSCIRSIDMTLCVNDAIREAEAQHAKAVKEIQRAKQNILEWKRRMTNIPQLERHYRGKMALEQLNKSETGKDIVAALTDNITKDVLRLTVS